MGWLTGYNYRKAITVTGSIDGAQTDLTHIIRVHGDNGADSGNDLYMDGQCSTGLHDIAFTSYDGETELPFFRIPPYANAFMYYTTEGSVYTESQRSQYFNNYEGTPTVEGIWLPVKRTGSPTNFKVQLRTSLTGEDLAICTVADPSYISTSLGWYYFKFSSPYTLSNNTTYWIVCDATGNSSNAIGWARTSENNFYEGMHYHNSTSYSNEDACFRLQYTYEDFIIKLGSVAANPDTTTFYVYYNKADIEETAFDFDADFDYVFFSGEVFPGLLNKYTLGGNAYSYSPHIRLIDGKLQNGYAYEDVAAHPDQYELWCDLWISYNFNRAYTFTGQASTLTGSSNPDDGFGVSFVYDANDVRLYADQNIIANTYRSDIDDANYHRNRFKVTTSGGNRYLSVWFDGNLDHDEVASAHSPAAGSNYFELGAWSSSSNGRVYLIWFGWRKITHNEPTLAWGAETEKDLENTPGTASLSLTSYFPVLEDTRIEPTTLEADITAYEPTAIPTTKIFPTTAERKIMSQVTFNGRLDLDGGEACTCGFEYGLTVALGTTVTCPGTYRTGDLFSITVIIPSVTIYYYRSFATNSSGTTYGITYFFGKAPFVTTLLPTDTATLTPTLNGQLGRDYSVATECRFNYGTTPSMGTRTSLQSIAEFNNYSDSITVLPSTTYYYQAEAISAAGTSVGIVRSFTTPTGSGSIGSGGRILPEYSIETLAPTNISENWANANGRVQKMYGYPGKVWFEYGLTTAYGSKSREQNAYDGDEFTDRLKLSPGQSFHYRAVLEVLGQIYYGGDMHINTPSNLGPVTFVVGDIYPDDEEE